MSWYVQRTHFALAESGWTVCGKPITDDLGASWSVFAIVENVTRDPSFTDCQLCQRWCERNGLPVGW